MMTVGLPRSQKCAAAETGLFVDPATCTATWECSASAMRLIPDLLGRRVVLRFPGRFGARQRRARFGLARYAAGGISDSCAETGKEADGPATDTTVAPGADLPGERTDRGDEAE